MTKPPNSNAETTRLAISQNHHNVSQLLEELLDDELFDY